MSVPISLFRIGMQSWLLSASDGTTLDARQVCVQSVCSRHTAVTVLEDGCWRVAPQNLEVRWVTASTARVRVAGSDWSDATLSSITAADVPDLGPVPMSPVSSHGVVPGLWYKETLDCDPKRPAWIFEPLQAGETSIRASQRAGGWTFEGDAHVAMCTGGKYGGVFVP